MTMIGEATDYIAKRKHKQPCSLCGDPILVGQNCAKWVWKDDILISVRVHVECEKEASTYDWYSDPDGWPDQYPLREERAQHE